MQPKSGVQRYAEEICQHFSPSDDMVGPSSSRWSAGFKGHLWEQVILGVGYRSHRLFSPANTGPLLHPNQVVVIHDAATLDHPEWFSRAFGYWYRLLIPTLLSRARAIITVSDASRRRLIHHVPRARGKIHVVHNGISDTFSPASSNEIERVRGKYGIKGEYFIYVGSLEPRKNLKTLLKAWKKINAGKEVTLILAGGALGRVYSSGLEDDLPKNVKAIGRFIDEDLPGLYSGAISLVYPSLYEGFGFPILEAMRCGVPVVFSRIPSHTEITETLGSSIMDEGFSFPATDVDSLAEALERVKNISLEERQQLSVEFRKHAESFTWERCFQETERVLEDVWG